MSDPADLVVTRPDQGLIVVSMPETCLAEASVDATRQKLVAIIDGMGDGELQLDFAQVEYLDSRALATLVALHRRAALAHGRMVCDNLAPDLMKMFQLTRLDTILDVRPKDVPP